jgi:transposase
LIFIKGPTNVFSFVEINFNTKEGLMVYALINQEYCCGVDLHAREMFLCIMDKSGKALLHKNMACAVENLSQALKPFLGKIAVGVESTYNWYWLGDACHKMGIPFYLGHALYMKNSFDGKQKNDKVDSFKIANLMRTHYFPVAYAYPEAMRTTRDLLRRRAYYVRIRASAYAHIRNTFTQYGINDVGALDVRRKSTRNSLPERLVAFPCAAVSLAQDLQSVETCDDIIDKLEQKSLEYAKHHDQPTYRLLQTIPGVGMVLALVLMYEIHTIERFSTPQRFSSYCRLVRAQRHSAGKNVGGSVAKGKIGNPYLKWAFSEIIATAQQFSPPIKQYYEKLKAKFGPARSKSVIAHRFGVAVYYMLKHGKGFDERLFVSQNYGGKGEPSAQLVRHVRTERQTNGV